MKLVLILLGSAAALELLIHFVRPLWRIRRSLAVIALVANAFSAGALLLWQFNAFTVLFLLIGLYRLVNLIRLAENRMHEKHLFHATRHTVVALLAMQAIIIGAWWAWDVWHEMGQMMWLATAGLQLSVALLLLLSVTRTLRRTRWPVRDKAYSNSELPTLTVAIPARNETEDLQQCLQSLIASDYPKLEIIVLDDCSQLKRTPEIIRDFAHDGVRFIQGLEPSEQWLPKNQAYQRLAQEASGQYMLFCGVDVRFTPQTLREVVSLLLDRDKAMVSLLPRRVHDAYGHQSLIQAMRYWWELVPPRRLFNRPPVLSSAWIIKTEALNKMGGFKAVARSIVPEAYFARELTKTDGYSFLQATHATGLSSTKRADEQLATAARTRYPQLHRRPEQVVLVVFLEFSFLVLPFMMAIAGFWVSIGALAQSIAAVTSILLIVAYQRVVLSTHVNNVAFSLVGHPLMVLTDIIVMHYSMWKYEFDEVDWKGRNVCVPVMHVVPRLPKIDN
jgi:hypothetical protein